MCIYTQMKRGLNYLASFLPGARVPKPELPRRYSPGRNPEEQARRHNEYVGKVAEYIEYVRNYAIDSVPDKFKEMALRDANEGMGPVLYTWSELPNDMKQKAATYWFNHLTKPEKSGVHMQREQAAADWQERVRQAREEEEENERRRREHAATEDYWRNWERERNKEAGIKPAADYYDEMPAGVRARERERERTRKMNEAMKKARNQGTQKKSSSSDKKRSSSPKERNKRKAHSGDTESNKKHKDNSAERRRQSEERKRKAESEERRRQSEERRRKAESEERRRKAESEERRRQEEAENRRRQAEAKTESQSSDPASLLGLNMAELNKLDKKDHNECCKTISKAYRKQTLKYHPDKNPGNQEAEDIFKSLGTAKDKLDLMFSCGDYEKNFDHNKGGRKTQRRYK